MTWTAYIDGGSRGNPGPAGAGVYLIDARGRAVFAAGFFLGRKTNNEAEYQGLLNGLRMLEVAGATQVRILSDSELLVRQIRGEYRVKSPGLRPLFEQAQARLGRFRNWQIEHVFREQNTMADMLANRAMDAGDDAIETDMLNLWARGEPSAVEGGADKTNSAGHAGIVEVRVIRAPNPGGCPAGMDRGQIFFFGQVTPAGFCTQACSAVLRAIASLQIDHPKHVANDAPISVRCERSGCEAVFELRGRSDA